MDSTTSISCGKTTIPNVHLTRGVKQGDPLSPLLFNMIIDELLDLLPKELGAKLYEVRCNALGFADDIILITNEANPAQELLRLTTHFFNERSMRINAKKCFSLSLEMSRKDRSPFCITEPRFFIEGQPIPPTTDKTFFKYLGILFGPSGKQAPSVETLKELLYRVKKSPLKVQQKLILVREFILPKISYKLVLGRFTKALFQKFDQLIRDAVRDILGLPSDLPTASFYTKIKFGGLGIQETALTAPTSIFKRASTLKNSKDPVIKCLGTSPMIEKLINTCVNCMPRNDEGLPLEPSKTSVEKHHTNAWFNSVDGSGLRQTIDNRQRY